MSLPNHRPHRARAAAAAALIAGGSLTVGLAGTAFAADPLGTVTAFAPDAGAVLTGEILPWQGELLTTRTGAGFTAFNSITGAAATSPIATVNPVRTMTTFNGQLALIDSTATVKLVNPGGTVTSLGAAAATSDSLLGVGAQMWISKTGGVDRYTPAGTLGGATALGAFGATSVLRMAAGPDGNVWVIEKNPAGVDTLTRWTPGGVAVGAAFNFANSAADPSAIVAGPDNAMWVIESGTNAIARFDANLALAEYPLPAGANPQALAAGPDGAVWVTENAINSVSRLSFASGAFTRVAYAAPSSFGLKGLVAGPDGNLWAVGVTANKVAKFGTVVPATTTTLAPTTTAAPTTAAPTTAAPTTAAPTTAAPTTAAPTVPPTAAPVTIVKVKRCVKTVIKVVKVGKKKVRQAVCTKYVIS